MSGYFCYYFYLLFNILKFCNTVSCGKSFLIHYYEHTVGHFILECCASILKKVLKLFLYYFPSFHFLCSLFLGFKDWSYQFSNSLLALFSITLLSCSAFYKFSSTLSPKISLEFFFCFDHILLRACFPPL